MRDVVFLAKLKNVYYIPIIIALVAILPIDSFSFYMFVRWALTISFVSTLFLLFIAADELWWAPIVGIIGVIDFNPINITTNTKTWWIVIDLLTAAYFFGITKSLENTIESIRHDKKIEASLPKDYHEKEAERIKKHKASLEEKDRKVLEFRIKNKITEEKIEQWKKDMPLYPHLSDNLTRAERDAVFKKQRRDETLMMLGFALFIAVIAVAWHIYKTR
jgi:hypothetical protein